MAKKQECCENCKFWKNKHTWMETEDRQISDAECHRNPPSTNGHDTYFPRVFSNNWCGEFKWNQ